MERVTEKKLKNKKFRDSEAAIRRGFFLLKNKLSVERLIKVAKISRSTLYRHHKNIHEVIPNYERFVLRRCKNTMRHLARNKRIRLKTLYERLLIFMSANRPIMEFLLEFGDRNFIEKIVFALEPKITATGKVNNGEMFKIYAKEVAGLIETWGHAGFDPDAIPIVINKIIYLTDTAHIRLSPLTSFDPPKPITSNQNKS